jgi:hypothetical protein
MTPSQVQVKSRGYRWPNPVVFAEERLSPTKLSLLLIAGGVVWLGAELMEDRNNPMRHRVPTAADLASVTGELVGARVVEQKTKKGVLYSHYTELDIKGGHDVTTVRVGEPHRDQDLEGLDSAELTATYDPKDDMRVYSLKTKDREVISYQKSMDFKTRLVESNGGSYTWGWIAVALGLAGLWLTRKSGASEA